MDTTASFEGLQCVDCQEVFDAAEVTHRCSECNGILDPIYDYDKIDLDREEIESRRFDSMWRYEELLPFRRESAITLGAGATPLIDCPNLADLFGVEQVLFKDEGRNPTGTFKDRGQTIAITAAVQNDATDIALASAGNAGQSAAAYAARGNLEAHVFLPERAGMMQKSMVEVHGGDLTVVDGQLTDAGAEVVG